MTPPTRHRSSLVPLALLYVALVVYASLYPFSGWRVPGFAPWDFVFLPWPRWWTGFDLGSNLVGYLPLGALVCGAWLRSSRSPPGGVVVALLAGTTLSGTLEVLQNYLPSRVPSNLDWGLNTLGTLGGALAAWLAHQAGWMQRWQQVRDRWFIQRSAGGLTLLLLWPTALLFPTPVPLGVGQVALLAHELALDWVRDTPLEAWVPPAHGTPAAALAPGMELIAIAAGLLAPCLLAYTVSPASWRRIVLVLGAMLLGFLATTLSTALSFGPHNAMAWLTPATPLGWGLGGVVALALVFVPNRAAALVGGTVVAAMMVLVNQAPADPYFAQTLSGWEQGRFIRFHGLAQWVGWLWPYAALIYLATRALARDEPRPLRLS